ncbi:MAG: hypothetical protein P0Y65_12500 [Candidatus Devosia phytovorans]|uniref:Type VI secretion system protein VasI n=1 Tax=Candidatus Devosia phytovorans TaxID=3121372 RepID=A0AAJ5VRY2_9HYPH|nr:hypothetical protein [Devosia sp.]WEK03025.1 MAG: hypothetical protein P0Y65_12500 [Devosia sp.]
MRLLPVLALLPILTVSTPAVMAQQLGAQCVSIAADAERLACFDAAFANPVSANGDLQVVFDSEQSIPARPSGRAPATITVSCSADVLSVAFGFAGNTLSALGSDTGITWQLDLGGRTNRTLPVDDSNTAILLDNTRDSLAFLRGLEGASNLTVRVTPINSRTLSVRYQLGDFAAQLAPVVGACEG